MPVPQRVDFLVECTILARTGKMPVPQRVDFLVERAGEPVHKRLINNGETSQFQLRYCTLLARTGFGDCSTKSEFSCGAGRRVRP